jgi:hypothetical protein
MIELILTLMALVVGGSVVLGAVLGLYLGVIEPLFRKSL